MRQDQPHGYSMADQIPGFCITRQTMWRPVETTTWPVTTAKRRGGRLDGRVAKQYILLPGFYTFVFITYGQSQSNAECLKRKIP